MDELYASVYPSYDRYVPSTGEPVINERMRITHGTVLFNYFTIFRSQAHVDQFLAAKPEDQETYVLFLLSYYRTDDIFVNMDELSAAPQTGGRMRLGLGTDQGNQLFFYANPYGAPYGVENRQFDVCVPVIVTRDLTVLVSKTSVSERVQFVSADETHAYLQQVLHTGNVSGHMMPRDDFMSPLRRALRDDYRSHRTVPCKASTRRSNDPLIGSRSVRGGPGPSWNPASDCVLDPDYSEHGGVDGLKCNAEGDGIVSYFSRVTTGGDIQGLVRRLMHSALTGDLTGRAGFLPSQPLARVYGIRADDELDTMRDLISMQCEADRRWAYQFDGVIGADAGTAYETRDADNHRVRVVHVGLSEFCFKALGRFQRQVITQYLHATRPDLPPGTLKTGPVNATPQQVADVLHYTTPYQCFLPLAICGKVCMTPAVSLPHVLPAIQPLGEHDAPNIFASIQEFLTMFNVQYDVNTRFYKLDAVAHSDDFNLFVTIMQDFFSYYLHLVLRPVRIVLHPKFLQALVLHDIITENTKREVLQYNDRIAWFSGTLRHATFSSSDAWHVKMREHYAVVTLNGTINSPYSNLYHRVFTYLNDQLIADPTNIQRIVMTFDIYQRDVIDRALVDIEHAAGPFSRSPLLSASSSGGGSSSSSSGSSGSVEAAAVGVENDGYLSRLYRTPAEQCNPESVTAAFRRIHEILSNPSPEHPLHQFCGSHAYEQFAAIMQSRVNDDISQLPTRKKTVAATTTMFAHARKHKAHAAAKRSRSLRPYSKHATSRGTRQRVHWRRRESNNAKPKLAQRRMMRDKRGRLGTRRRSSTLPYK